MRIVYQGTETETAARTVGEFVDAKFPQRACVLVEYKGEAYGAGADLDSLPLEEGAELNVFKIVAGG